MIAPGSKRRANRAETEERGMSVSVEAQVTGRVVRIEKNVGDSVAEEDTLLILESMKMEIPVEAVSYTHLTLPTICSV